MQGRLLRLLLVEPPENLAWLSAASFVSGCSIHKLVLCIPDCSAAQVELARNESCHSCSCTTLLLPAMLVLQAALLSLKAIMQEQP